jgi:hypothetical protein
MVYCVSDLNISVIILNGCDYSHNSFLAESQLSDSGTLQRKRKKIKKINVYHSLISSTCICSVKFALYLSVHPLICSLFIIRNVYLPVLCVVLNSLQILWI